MKPGASKKRRNGQTTRVTRRSINAVAKRIAERFDPDCIILFGSYAYGRPHPYSDVDLLVVLTTNERTRAKQLEITRALSPHPFGMDILVRTPEQLRERIAMGDYFLREIVTKGQVVYERPRR
jgi:predicted nucleotidyltransferase